MTPLQQYEYFFELVNDSVMTRTLEGRINFWNRSAEELYGWRKEEAIGTVSHNLLQTQFPKPLEEIESELVRNRQWEGRLVHTTRDGRRVAVKSRWTLELEEQSGGLIEINTRSTDREMRTDEVTAEHKRAKKLMEHTMTPLQQYEYVFELVNDSVMTRTLEGRINFWNRSAEKLYGWRKEEAIGKVSHNLLQTQFPKPLEEIESELVRNRQWEGRLVHTTRDGRRVAVKSRWTLELKEQSGGLIEINTRSADRELDPEDRIDTDSVEIGSQRPAPVSRLMKANDLLSKLASSVRTPFLRRHLSSDKISLFLPRIVQRRPTLIVFLCIAMACVLYGLFGHRLIDLIYTSKSPGIADKIMEGRAFTSIENYWKRADELAFLGGFWLVVTYIGAWLVVRKPVAVLLATLSLLFTSFVIFCFFEMFPSLIRPAHLDLTSAYYAYKVNWIYDRDLVFREKPFKNEVLPAFKGTHYSPLYGIDVPPVTVVWVTDKNGFRNSRTIESADVVVLGDSYVEFGDNEADTFVERLETRLPGLTVINLGKSGYGPAQYLEVFKKYGLTYKPKYALLSFYEGNDLHDLEHYLDWKQRGKVTDDPDLLYGFPHDSFFGRYRAMLAATAASIAERLSFLKQAILYKIAASQGYAYGTHPRLTVIDLGSGGYHKIKFVDFILTESADDMQKSRRLRELSKVLEDFKAICQDNNIVPLVVYIPSATHIYAEYSTETSGENWIWIRDSQIAAKDNTRNAVKHLVQDLDIAFIDISPTFEIAAKQGKLLYYPLDSHWNSEGREIAAAFVADVLESKFSLNNKPDRTTP